jgi:hypothetical protein
MAGVNNRPYAARIYTGKRILRLWGSEVSQRASAPVRTTTQMPQFFKQRGAELLFLFEFCSNRMKTASMAQPRRRLDIINGSMRDITR